MLWPRVSWKILDSKRFDDWNQKGKVLEWTIKRSIEKDNTIVVECFFKCEFEGNIDGFDGVTIADFDKRRSGCSMLWLIRTM